MTTVRQLRRACGHSFIPAAVKPGSTIIDLGANDGRFASEMRANFEVRVCAVEPLMTLAPTLARIPDVEVWSVGIGPAGKREATLHLYKQACASVVRFYDHPFYGSQDQHVGELVVPLRTIEEVFSHFGAREVALLKVDIEGAELDAFADATDEVLRSCQQITVEFHDFMLPETRSVVKAAISCIQNLGFRVVSMGRWHMDVLFCRRDLQIGNVELLYWRYWSQVLVGRQERGSKVLEQLRSSLEHLIAYIIDHRCRATVRLPLHRCA